MTDKKHHGFVIDSGGTQRIITGSYSKSIHTYEVLPRNDHRGGIDLISDVLPFGRLWYGGPEAVANAIGYAQFYSRAHSVVIRVYDAVDNVIETHEHTGDFKEP